MSDVAELDGITLIDCPKACNAERCVITDRAHCGHPKKGGLQGVDNDHEDKTHMFHSARIALGMIPIPGGLKE